MGSNLVGRSYPGKTQAQAQKLWDRDCEQNRHEDGHSYSGGIGMLGSGRVTTLIFNNHEEFDDFLEEKDKGDAYWAQIKVIRITKPLEKAREQARLESNFVWSLKSGVVHDSVIKQATTKRNKAIAKVKKIEAEQAAKSTKTTWCVGGWASS